MPAKTDCARHEFQEGGVNFPARVSVETRKTLMQREFHRSTRINCHTANHRLKRPLSEIHPSNKPAEAMRNTLRAAVYELQLTFQDLLGNADAPKELIDRIATQKKLIFTVTNGRSGSLMLARLFDAIDGVMGLHEPAPSFHLLMRWAQGRPDLARKFWLHEKLPAIDRLKTPVYVETSHLLCKGFLESLLDTGLRPSLVFLTRDPRETAVSLYRLNDIPGRTNRAFKWYLSPDDPTYAVLPTGAEDKLTDYQLCYWHSLETAARISHYQTVAANMGLPNAVLDVEDLNNFDSFVSACTKLGISMSEESQSRLRQQIGNKANERKSEKRAMSFSDEELARQEQDVSALITMPGAPPSAANNASFAPLYLRTALRGL